jgi:alpha-methylacyl-CoA racemase
MISSDILKGIRVLDLSRLAPGPYGSMLLADMGADVVIVAGGPGSFPIECYGRGKSTVTLDLKSDVGKAAFLDLAKEADVVIEGYRPGVASRLGIGFEDLKVINERLIYCSLTGYGQDGPMALEAGHDLNYAALSGLIGAMGPADDAPQMPLNVVADFAGGGLYAAFAIVSALFERERSGLGQHLDVAMVDGCLSLMAMHYLDWGKPVLPARGRGLLTGDAPFYRCYLCADGAYVAVASLEGAFFRNLWIALGFDDPVPDHMSRATWPEIEKRLTEAFSGRSRDEWVAHFAGRDACVSPVLSPDEVFSHPHIVARHPEASDAQVPALPRASRTPGRVTRNNVAPLSEDELRRLGLSETEIREAKASSEKSLRSMSWPPVRD